MAFIKNTTNDGEVVVIVLHCGSAVAKTGFPGLILQKGWQWPGEAKVRNFGYMDNMC